VADGDLLQYAAALNAAVEPTTVGNGVHIGNNDNGVERNEPGAVAGGAGATDGGGTPHLCHKVKRKARRSKPAAVMSPVRSGRDWPSEGSPVTVDTPGGGTRTVHADSLDEV
jgi:hypothetical protein